MSTPRIRMPASAKAGEPIEIRTLIDHPMETGLRQQGGQTVPRKMIVRFEALADGELLFAADFRNGTSANPYLAFIARFEKTTALTFVWREEDGREYRATQRISVS
ncbi:thiosulfate oxidation carrier complex protein SoxZ [Phreatobacter sp.]|uniref:thiosulfate oxidation carrier complex protein SoxZ n=1 Tax=Phreatobacter sp. TaxID=1966341 RepID=UPI0022BB30E1|nr:thiosulfate oxidation carrier complex protein SoxZ [Phreatobacter sp.]MCZ8314303.1 thiosulfate oxidation carrier complex protein SoxZ [Phreatobacter sp.]